MESAYDVTALLSGSHVQHMDVLSQGGSDVPGNLGRSDSLFRRYALEASRQFEGRTGGGVGGGVLTSCVCTCSSEIWGAEVGCGGGLLSSESSVRCGLSAKWVCRRRREDFDEWLVEGFEIQEKEVPWTWEVG